MEAAAFTRPTGELLRLPGPDGGDFLAFRPAPLPPADERDALASNATALAEANHALGQLDGLGLVLPNPDLLVRPYIRREAVLSSRIEGTQTSFSDLIAIETVPSAVTPDGREVLNYVEALDHGLRHVSAEGITADLVRTLHRMLMQRGRGEAFATPGEFRTIQNQVGAGLPSQARYVPPPPAAALDGMDALFAYLANPAPTTQVLVEAAWIHYQFEALHPFLDGNGRVGRLLVPLLLAWRRKLSHPLLYVSPFFEHHRTEYYDRLFDVSARGDWSGWLGFFLEAVRSQAAHGVALATRIIALGKTWHDRLDAVRAPQSAHRLADLVHQFIALDAGTAERMLGVAGQTAYTAIRTLVGAGILEEAFPNVRRGQVYRAPELVRLMESPVVPRW